MPAGIGRLSADLGHGQPRADEAPALEQLMTDVAAACLRAERLVVSVAGLEQSIIASAADELLAAYRGLARAREVGQSRQES